MTNEEYLEGLHRAGVIQRRAGWSEESIISYAKEMDAMMDGNYGGVLIIGAGLACDNTRHGVPLDLKPPKRRDANWWLVTPKTARKLRQKGVMVRWSTQWDSYVRWNPLKKETY